MVMDDGMRSAVLQSSVGNHERAAIWIAEDGGSRHWDDGIVPYEIDDSLSKYVSKCFLQDPMVLFKVFSIVFLFWERVRDMWICKFV